MQIVADEILKFSGHSRVNLDPNNRSKSTLFQTLFEFTNKVFGLFFDFNVGVADEAEDP